MWKKMMKPYKIVDDQYIELIDPPYTGIVYQYGRVELLPDEGNDELKLSFDINFFSKKVPDDMKAFEQYAGDLLLDLITEKLQTNDIVYTGGT
jgi:hypothetical protein